MTDPRPHPHQHAPKIDERAAAIAHRFNGDLAKATEALAREDAKIEKAAADNKARKAARDEARTKANR